ncbi:helix-turn-helix domain-containing protein [Desulfovibrio aminophilus]|nr:helix-turn-helix domain-containing protein [Desulfovibrio aminophilus]
MALEKNRWHSADEIASHLGVSIDTVYRWIAGRSMPAHKVGRLWKFKTHEVDAWVMAGGAADKTDKPDTEQ